MAAYLATATIVGIVKFTLYWAPGGWLKWGRPFRLVSNSQQWTFETNDVTWSQKSTLVYTLNPELMRRSIVTDV